MFVIRKEQLEVFRAPLRRQKREELLQRLQLIDGNQVESQGDKIEVTDKKGRTSTLHYSEKNLLQAVSKPSGTRYELGYDEEDRLEKLAFPDNESLVLAYQENLPIHITLNGALIELQYDTKNRLSRMIYPDKKGVQFQYTEGNQLAAIIDRANAKQSYDSTLENNRLVHRMTDALGRQTTLFMDADCHPETIVFPDKSQYAIRYDEVLDAEVAVLRNGTERTTYFEGQQARRIEWEDGSFQEIEVNDSQQVTSLENATGTIAYGYDEKGRLLSESFQGSEVQYEYEDDYLKRMVYPGGLEVAYEYDEDDRLKGLRVDGQICSYGYAPNGTLSQIHYPNGLTECQANKVLGGLQDVQLKTATGASLYQHRYRYDQLFRLTAYEESEQGGPSVFRDLSYDDESRLTQITERASGKTESFRYDAKGNIIEAGKQKVVVGTMDEVRSTGRAAIEYDKAGNVIRLVDDEARSLRLQYADDGTLKLARVNGETWEYWYDALGRRVGKSNGKVAYRFFWSGKKLLREEYKDRDKATLREYIYTDSDVPVAFREGGQLYWLQQDVRGAVTRVYDSGGTLVWKAAYTAFGKAILSVAAIRQPWRLVGQYYDEESGLHYNFARYYSPYLRTFLSVDPQWYAYGATNYSYAGNDPYNRIDEDGNMPGWLKTVAAIGAGVVATVAVGAAIVALAPALAATTLGVIAVGAIAGAVGGVVGSVADDLLNGKPICWPCALKEGLIGAAFGALLGPVARLAGRALAPVAAKILPKIASRGKKLAQLAKNIIPKIFKKPYTVKPSKFDYFFGRVKTGPAHNIQRSAQNLKDLTQLGVKNEKQLTRVFDKALKDGEVVSTKTSAYGTTVTKAVNIGNKGSVDVSFLYRNGNMASPPEVTTIIPKIFK